jgi:hypothetical protein
MSMVLDVVNSRTVSTCSCDGQCYTVDWQLQVVIGTVPAARFHTGIAGACTRDRLPCSVPFESCLTPWFTCGAVEGVVRDGARLRHGRHLQRPGRRRLLGSGRGHLRTGAARG